MEFSLVNRIKSFSHAFRGAWTLVSSQHNAWIHLSATFIAIVSGALTGVSAIEWVGICLSIGMVWCAEALNTAIELIADEVTLEKRERIRNAKDVAAFAVLFAAACAFLVAVLIFVPRINY